MAGQMGDVEIIDFFVEQESGNWNYPLDLTLDDDPLSDGLWPSV